MSNTSPVTAHAQILLSSVPTSAVIVTLELSCAQGLGLCEAHVFQYAHFTVTKQITWYCIITEAISVMYIHGLCQSSFYTHLKSFRDFYKMFNWGTQRICKFILTQIRGRERGGAFGWDTALQAGKPKVQF
jgi:hypothetical protein